MTAKVDFSPMILNSIRPLLKDHSSIPSKLNTFHGHSMPFKSSGSLLHAIIDRLTQVLETCNQLSENPGVHSTIAMKAAGFRYTNKADAACCDTCGLEVSGWTAAMKPFTIHAQRSPTCAFVRSMVPESAIAQSVSTADPTAVSTAGDEQRPAKRLKKEGNEEICETNVLTEVKTLQEVRKRTFSHWPQQASPSNSQMIEAGFFGCNVGDRVICLYCNLICQQWKPRVDDPFEVHRILSPKCPYVVATTRHQQTASIRIVNEQLTRESVSASVINDLSHSNEIVYTAACHTAYIEIPRRHASFATWKSENLPPVDNLVRAGFFYTGTKAVVTCFYCNGSLQNWGPTDNPTIEHARWFPNCAYAKQLCGAELYRRIQESKKAQQEKAEANDSHTQRGNPAGSFGRGHLLIPDESTLSRYVAARIDLPVSQDLLNRNFKMSVIKRCYEDQLRLKHDDFIDICDVLIACIILQKQIECIGGKKENIVVPNIAMSKIREREQAETSARKLTADTSLPTNSLNARDVDMTTSSASSSSEQSTQDSVADLQNDKERKREKTSSSGKDLSNGSSSANLCVLCLEEQRYLACIPCGHLATCVPCGHSLRSCPICRTAIDAFVRIYI